MKHKIFILMAVLLVFTIAGCDTEKEVANIDANGYVEATFGETLWYASAYGVWILINENGITSHHLSIVGLRETVASSDEVLDLSIVEHSALSAGEFDLAKLDSEAKHISRFFDSEGAFGYDFVSGRLVIDSLSTDRATGTFYGILLGAKGDTLAVTNGVFDVPIDYQNSVN